MLQVTARVFDNNQLVGYQITDGSQTQLFTRQQAWIFAKNKQLLNVVATGDETNPGLSGTNGFELKRLPEIKLESPDIVNTYFTPERVGASKHKTQLIGKDILVENALINTNEKTGMNSGVIGYKIKNTGAKPITITRITATPDHSTSQVVLSSEQSMCLNRAELASLATKPEIGCDFANSRLVYTHRGQSDPDKYKELSRYFVSFGKHINEVSVEIHEVETQSSIERYFIPNSATENIQQKDLFNGFKR